YACRLSSLIPRYSCRNASCAGPSFWSTGSTCVLPIELLSSRNTAFSSARELVAPKIIDPAASKKRERRIFRYFIAYSFLSPRLEIEPGLDHQSVRVRREALRVVLRIEAVRVRAESIPIHEMTFQFHIPESIEINPYGDDFVVDMIARQAGIGLVGH